MEDKMMLKDAAETEAIRAHASTVTDFLAAERPNVVGLGVGTKVKNGQPTGEPALIAFVSQKVDRDQLSRNELVPAKLGEMQTDVLEVGVLFAGRAAPPRTTRHTEDVTTTTSYPTSYPFMDGDGRGMLEVAPPEIGIEVLKKRVRPAEGGYSVGHFKITAGTIATCVYDIFPSPPGVGVPPKFYILSNNHVLANSNAASIGDPILQPGPFDGGTFPADVIAHLSRFVPIQFNPPIPLAQQRNVVDCAVAEGEFHDLDREIYWIGNVRGWLPKAGVKVGTLVKKTGRTTNFTTGRITAINATVDVNYGGGKVARFQDQIVTTNISAGGDSGSAVLTWDNMMLGLLFAGSSTVTILNQFENVRSLLKVEVFP
jgi:hypothetical protein